MKCFLAGIGFMGLLLFPFFGRAGELRLPAILGDHAMVQAGKEIPVWGRAAAGVPVKVQFLNDAGVVMGMFETNADATGCWVGKLPAVPPGKAGRLQVDAAGERKVAKDILSGEVWLASGQSNMTYNIAGNPYAPLTPPEVSQVAVNCETARRQAAAAQPPIRVFQVGGPGSDRPEDDVHGRWVLAAPSNVTMFSAVAWFFGAALQDDLQEPVGLVISAVGGTPVEAWMPIETLRGTSVGAAVEDRFHKMLEGYTPEKEKADNAVWDAWVKAYPTQSLQEQNRATRPHRLITPTVGLAPARLYNGMIHGLEPYALRGVIWFQADGNEGHPLEYSELIQALIRAWRVGWKDELPFYYVEMNNMRHDPQQAPVEFNNLSLIREQQQGALQLPKAGVAASIDLGVNNAHFANKIPVGKRLAGLALHEVYGRPGLVYSPQFKGFRIEGNKVHVEFDDADGLRVRGGGEVAGFALRGEKGPWVWAKGSIEGTGVMLSNEKVPHPAAVRYAWAMFPVLSIENEAGLPLRPFRTDTQSPQ